MATNDVYHPGGYDPAAPAHNIAERLTNDGSAPGYTAWDEAGKVTVQRALTASESQALVAADVENLDQSNATTLQQRAAAALQTNATFIALGSNATAAQVRAWTLQAARELNGIIRLLVTQDTSTISDS